jgi:hypothetical protein
MRPRTRLRAELPFALLVLAVAGVLGLLASLALGCVAPSSCASSCTVGGQACEDACGPNPTDTCILACWAGADACASQCEET